MPVGHDVPLSSLYQDLAEAAAGSFMDLMRPFVVEDGWCQGNDVRNLTLSNFLVLKSRTARKAAF